MQISKDYVSVKRNSKDSVFQMLFSEKEYQKQLMELLEPQLGEINSERIVDVTLENAFLNKPYNDLGLQYENKIIILVESQSTYTQNIALRQFMYLHDTIKNYLLENEISLHVARKIKLPEIGLYALCINPPKESPSIQTFELMHQGEIIGFCKVKLLRADNSLGIVGQYLEYCKRFDQMYKSGERQISTLLDQCISGGILADFFKKHYQEVLDMEDILFGDYAMKLMAENNNRIIREQEATLSKMDVELQQKHEELQQKHEELQQKNSELQQMNSELQQKDSELQQKDSELQQKDSELQQKNSELQQKDSELQQKDAELLQKDAALQESDKIIVELRRQLAEMKKGF